MLNSVAFQKLKTKQAQNILRDYAKPESNELVDDTQQQKLRLHSHIWRPRGLIQAESRAASSGDHNWAVTKEIVQLTPFFIALIFRQLKVKQFVLFYVVQECNVREVAC